MGSPNLSAPLVFWPLEKSKVGQKGYGLVYISFSSAMHVDVDSLASIKNAFLLRWMSQRKLRAPSVAHTVFDQLLIFLMGKKTVVQIGLGSPKTKFQSYRPINDSLPSIFVFGSIIMVKELLAELKFAIFKN